MDYKKVPQWLKNKDIFAVWQQELQGDRLTKIPYSPSTGFRAKTNQSTTFNSLAAALRVVDSYKGIGFRVCNGIVVIDLDHCISEDGIISEQANRIMMMFPDSYIEYSPSKKGLHLIMQVCNFAFKKDIYYIKNSKLDIEVYVGGATNRFMTLTGDCIQEGIDSNMGDVLQKFLDTYMLRPVPMQTAHVHSGECELNDNEIIQKANELYGERFKKLFAGDFSNYPSQSEADFHFCTMLASICNGNQDHMNAVYEGSGLMREKWHRAQSGSTYGVITMRNAIAAAGNVAEDFKERLSKPTDYSDAGNATAFAAGYRKHIIFTDGCGFLVWNGMKWEAADHAATALGLRYSERLLDDALREFSIALKGEDDKKHKKAKDYLKHAQYTRSAPGIKRMMDLSKPAFHKKLDQLDSNPFLVNTPIGMMDLKSGKYAPHDPGKYCSKITSVAPSNNEAEMWEKFLISITEGDKELENFLQCVAGMSLIGKVYQETAIFAFGNGRNGKSTFFNVLSAALGDYAGSIDVDILTTARQNKGASLATLQGKRLILASELEEGRRLSVSTLKAICSTDRIVAEQKYRAPESFTPSHSLVLFTNFLPRIGSNDSGTWRRVVVCPFQAVFEGKGTIQNYGEVLAQKAGGAVLTWAIEGAKQFIENGYKLPKAEIVEQVTEEYRKTEDWFSRFLGECCDTGKGRVSARELYQEFRKWSESTGEFVRRENEFARAMEAAGFEVVKPKNKKHYVGIVLQDTIEFLS